MNYGFNRFFEGRSFIKLLPELKLRNAMDCNVLHIVVSTEETLDVFRPATRIEALSERRFYPSRVCKIMWT